jgi:hypothetical protein
MASHPTIGSVRARQLALGTIVGCAVTSVPWLASKLNYEWLWPLNFLSLPGLIASTALSGNVHTYSMTMALAVNVTFYASLAYLFLRIRKKKVLRPPCLSMLASDRTPNGLVLRAKRRRLL